MALPRSCIWREQEPYQYEIAANIARAREKNVPLIRGVQSSNYYFRRVAWIPADDRPELDGAICRHANLARRRHKPPPSVPTVEEWTDNTAASDTWSSNSSASDTWTENGDPSDTWTENA